MINFYNIKVSLLSLSFLFFLNYCGTKKTNMINIGDVFPKEIDETGDYRMTSSGNIAPIYFMYLDNISYSICKDKEDNITYIETKDKNFLTVEGIKVGMNYGEVLKYTDNELQLERGWAYILPLSGGWNAAFELSKENMDEMSSDATIKWFFKR